MFNPFFHPLRQALLNYAPALNGAPSPIIQRGSFTIPVDSETADYTITGVDLSRTALFWCGISADGNQPDYDLAEVYLLNSTTVRAQRYHTSATATCSIEFCLIEFPASIINSIQTGHIYFGPGASISTFTITEVDLSKSIVVFNGSRTTLTSGTGSFLVRLSFANPTTVSASRRFSSGYVYTAFTVIEFS